MFTKVRFWLGVLAAVTLVSCAAPAPDVQVDEQAATQAATETVPAPEAAIEASAQATAEAAELARARAAAQAAKEAAEAAAAEARAKGTMTVSVPMPAGETTLLERIAGADAVVRAEFVSVTGVVDSFSVISGGEPQTPEFARGLAYTFNVLEYLKGSGGTQIVALALNSFERYPTKAEADAATDTYQADRDTQWDNREAILFLWDWDIGAPLSTEQTDRYTLGDIRGGPGWWDYYTIASKWNKRWLPSTAENSDTTPSQRSAGEQTGTERAYLLDVPTAPITAPGSPAAQASAPTITLTALKAEVAKIAAEVAAGDGSAAYERCIYEKYSYLRREAYHSAATKAGLEPGERQVVYRFDIGSGLAKDTRVNPEQAINFFAGSSGSLEGDDAGLFEVSTPGVVNTLRPLPAGEYVFTYLERPPYLDVCDVPIPDSFKKWSQYMVGVAAPNHVVHEAFFDPVTVGSAVKADSTNGTLSPSSFGTTTIESISYESNSIKATFAPADSLTDLQGGSLAFIEEDGTTLTLAVGDSTSSGGTLTWSVTTAPWADGDKLMLRVTVPPALTGLDLSDISLPFAFGTTSYAVTVPYNLTDTTVTATLNPTAKSYAVKVGGAVDVDRSVFLETIGGANTIAVEVAGPDGEVAKTYTVTVTREQFDYADPPIGLSVIRVNHDTVAVVYVHNQGARYHKYHSRSNRDDYSLL